MSEAWCGAGQQAQAPVTEVAGAQVQVREAWDAGQVVQQGVICSRAAWQAGGGNQCRGLCRLAGQGGGSVQGPVQPGRPGGESVQGPLQLVVYLV